MRPRRREQAVADFASTPADAGDAATPPAREAGTAPPPVDNGAPSTTYPAFKPDVPQLQNQGGDTLKSAHIVTVTWAGDANADDYEKFGDGLGGTDCWAAVTAEYGVGAATSAATDHIRMQTALAATITTSQLDAFVATNATGGAGADPSKWPAATKDTVYILYLPTTSALTIEGQGVACSIGVGGYHAATQTCARSTRTRSFRARATGLEASSISSSDSGRTRASSPATARASRRRASISTRRS